MPSGYLRHHIRVDQFINRKPYKRPNRTVKRPDLGRETERHAEKLKRDFAEACASTDELISSRDAKFEGDPGNYIDFETLPNHPLPDLNWTSKGIRLATSGRTGDGNAIGTIYVPEREREFIRTKLNEYQTKRSEKNGRPSHEARFASIEYFRAARLESLWVDRRPIPDMGVKTWWECWCWPDRIANFAAKALAANVTLGEGRLHFAEREVVFVFADQQMIARIVASSDAVAELRLGRDDASFYTCDISRDDQHGWIEAAVERLELDDDRATVSVCLLDTGVNRAHPLLAPIFSAEDLHSVNPDWGVDDHHGHGSEMSGLAIFGDLTNILSSSDPIRSRYIGESVKLLSPGGFEPTAPQSYGLITQQALLRPEIAKPDRSRVYCMAITQPEVFGPKATSWSATLDLSSFGGDELSDLLRRLVCVSAGNLPDGLHHTELEDRDNYEIEDPAHAWNVLTAGGYTQKGPIAEASYRHWACAAEVGALSPYSRVSAAWARGVSPIKPELVLEAGNQGIDTAGGNMISGIDSLSLLTTSNTPLTHPLALFWATSAATALLAGMGAELLADNNNLWPETVRALLTHSAQWTPTMEGQLFATQQKSQRLLMLRRFGYGVPSLERALRSASNSLALVAQQEIQPFIRERGRAPRLNQVHFYDLPWPKEALLELAEHEVRLRVTLSYFIEPNPSADAPLSPARYRSAGLRFDLRRRNETQSAFEARINDLAEEEEEAPATAAEDPGRVLGERSISAGSLHVDEWRCNAADLADRGSIAIFPVGGWWKTSKDHARNNGIMRYALIITIDAGDVEQDLWVETAITAGIEIEQNLTI
ncbi:S8 family peptidase [Gluconobacter sphaericus]|uniref:S8 family peptidase n=1 Tax=Gluconobacter sphaericus TaxID=574987 RepID=UPI001B8C453D|nr:S8 family peptidase [Gluconobacter sphaericus]MBS1087321.1 S8 family peptidase [Gluconobacter sphaericus]MBS1101375.1 S8 family peptidase [Gluconobacter sphaericus]